MQVNNSIYFKCPCLMIGSKNNMELGPQGEWISMPCRNHPGAVDLHVINGAESHTRILQLPSFPKSSKWNAWIFVSIFSRNALLSSPLSPTHPAQGTCPGGIHQMCPASESWCWNQVTWPLGSGSTPEETKNWWKYCWGGMTHPPYLLQLKDSNGEWWCVFLF